MAQVGNIQNKYTYTYQSLSCLMAWPPSLPSQFIAPECIALVSQLKKK